MSSVIRALLSFLMPSGNRAQPRFLRLVEVLEMTGMGKTFIYARMKDGTFPKQIQVGSRSVVWNEQEVIKWMEDQMAPDDRMRGVRKPSWTAASGRRVISRVFIDDFGKIVRSGSLKCARVWNRLPPSPFLLIVE